MNFKRRNTGLTQCYGTGLLTATGAATTHDTTIIIHYSIGGIAYRKATISGGTTPTTDGVSAAAMTLVGTATTGQACTFVWCLDSAGNVKVVQGAKVATDAAGNLLAPGLIFPDIPDTLVPFAYSVSKHAGQASTFTFGSSNWNVAGYTHTIYNVATLPERPQQS